DLAALAGDRATVHGVALRLGPPPAVAWRPGRGAGHGPPADRRRAVRRTAGRGGAGLPDARACRRAGRDAPGPASRRFAGRTPGTTPAAAGDSRRPGDAPTAAPGVRLGHRGGAQFE